jgi:hypothetical protein
VLKIVLKTMLKIMLKIVPGIVQIEKTGQLLRPEGRGL